MHMQGGQRGEKVAQPGTTVHEGNHIHEYEVVDAGYHNVTLRHKASGELPRPIQPVKRFL